jgi:hypothetical protein
MSVDSQLDILCLIATRCGAETHGVSDPVLDTSNLPDLSE